MARTARLKKQGDAYYHVMSRANNKAFLFIRGRMKKEMVSLLERAAAFSGVELKAFCMMDSHFHVVCRVARPEGPVPEPEVLSRIGKLKGGRFALDLKLRWMELRKSGMAETVEAELNAWRRRMHDVSEFAKTYKELVSIAYKRETRYAGSIWSGRFASTLVEPGHHLAVCIRYVELNPVRAGIVTQAKDYAYSSSNSSRPNVFWPAAGSVPGGGGCGGEGGDWPLTEEEEKRLLRRIAQIGAGKIFGSLAFVQKTAFAFGRCFNGAAAARPVFASAYSTHGHRLAAEEAA